MKGVKHDEEKLPYFTVLCEQFPNALRAVVERSLKGHEKYKESDEDWKNWERVEEPFKTYSNAMMRHIFREGGDGELEHLAATAWNALARLEIRLKPQNCGEPPWGFPTMDTRSPSYDIIKTYMNTDGTYPEWIDPGATTGTSGTNYTGPR